MKILPLVIAIASTLVIAPPIFPTSTNLATPRDANSIELAQSGIPPATRSVRVQFAKGKSSATVSGQVKGYETVDYLLNGRAGQKMTVNISSNNDSLTPIIIGPQGESVCSDPCEFPWNGTLSASGDYRVRVGIVRAEARDGGKANYTVTVGITGS